jgi:hypothetical protein
MGKKDGKKIGSKIDRNRRKESAETIFTGSAKIGIDPIPIQ